MIIFVSIIAIYVIILVIRRLYKGFYGTWMQKLYFYLDISAYKKYGCYPKVRCKRLGYILNPFAKTITLVVKPFNRIIPEKVFIKIERDSRFDEYGTIKSIKGGSPNEIFFENFSLGNFASKSLKESYIDYSGIYYKCKSVPIYIGQDTYSWNIVFRGDNSFGILRMYNYKMFK